MDVSGIVLQGLQQADSQLNTAAAQIANAGGSQADPNPDAVNLSEEMTALITAQTQFAANLATLKTADQIEQSLVDVTA